MARYSTLLFDADDTLLDFGKDETDALTKVMTHYGIAVTKENIETYKSINVSLWKALERGEITKPELKRIRFRQFFEAIGITKDIDYFAVNESYLSYLACGGNLKKGAKELVTQLKAQGFDLYIITNGIAATQHKRLTKSGILPLFTEIFVSEAIGYQKPRREYFDCVLEKIKEKDKSRVLVIGDSLTSDIKGAMNSGLDSAWLRSDTDTAGYEPTYIIDSLEDITAILE